MTAEPFVILTLITGVIHYGQKFGSTTFYISEFNLYQFTYLLHYSLIRLNATDPRICPAKASWTLKYISFSVLPINRWQGRSTIQNEMERNRMEWNETERTGSYRNVLVPNGTRYFDKNRPKKSKIR